MARPSAAFLRGQWRAVADDNGLGPSGQDPGKVHDTACKVLAAPCSPSAPSVQRQVSGPNIGGLLTVIVYAVIAIVLVALVYLIVRTLRNREQVDESATDNVADDEPTTIVDHTRAPAEWRAEAARLSTQGKFREALRCRYRALVGDLARRGLLDEIPGRTTGEERSQFAETGSVAEPAFNEATALFDEVWYGDEPAGVAEHDRFVEREREVLAATVGRQRRRLPDGEAEGDGVTST